MDNETGTNFLYSLIPLDDYKAILGIDDRDDALSRYCLITATFTIEQYCKRRFCRKKHTDYLTFSGEHIQGPNALFYNYDFSGPHTVLPYSENRLTGSPALVGVLREYPVRRVLAVHAARAGAALRGEPLFTSENLVDSKHYYCIPDEGIHEDSDLWSAPFSLVLRPPYRLTQEEMGIQVRYLAGYSTGKAPPDLASACLELAAWNMSRYRGPPPRSGFLIGMTGAVRGSGKDGEHLEASMPENVKQLLEPYRRRVI
jgi:hypothetical protein